MSENEITQHDNEDGYHLDCMCDYCRPTTLLSLSNKAKTPDSIKEHSSKFKHGIWGTYTINELGMWVHLFLKRAKHRSDKAKARKDVMDAQNYLNMMQSKIDKVRKDVS